jgi:hypothetical protein
VSKNLKIRIYKIIILHVVLCGYETWSVTLREEHRLSFFFNIVVHPAYVIFNNILIIIIIIIIITVILLLDQSTHAFLC